MRTALALGLAISLFALSTPGQAVAEKANTPVDAMHKAATNVITGTVQSVYARKERKGGYEVTRYVAEIKVIQDDKGSLKKDQLAYVRYWSQQWVGRGMPPTGTSGHNRLPKQGQTIKVYAVSKGHNGLGQTTDGGLDVWGVNGFQPAAIKLKMK